MTEPSERRTPEDICRDLRRLRPRVLAARAKADALFEEQKRLVVEGHYADVSYAEMARAMDVGDQAIRDILRKKDIYTHRRPGPKPAARAKAS